MFDIFSKITEAKKRIEEVKTALASKQVKASNSNQTVEVVVLANKDIQSINIQDALLQQPKHVIEQAVLEACQNALNQAETIAKEEMKKATEGILPNIPGLNLFG